VGFFNPPHPGNRQKVFFSGRGRRGANDIHSPAMATVHPGHGRGVKVSRLYILLSISGETTINLTCHQHNVVDMEDKFNFYRKVDQTAFELRQRHGRGAHRYAARLSQKAEAEGDEADFLFWRAVEAALLPRNTSG